MNPLFKRFAEAMAKAKHQDDAVRAAQKLIRSTRGGRSFKDLGAVRRGMRTVSKAVKSGDRLQFGRLSQLVKDTLWNELMRGLGPLGPIVGALLRPSQQALTNNIDRELKAAMDLLNQFGYEVTPPTQRTGSETGLSTPPSTTSRVAPPMTPTQPLSTPGERVGEQPAIEAGTSNYVTKVVDGRRYRIRRDDPILTGQMIKVKSSNVHSIGYIWKDSDPARGTLQVRFLDHRKGRGANRAGAGYQYFEVHPKVFVAFTTAASKGKFVWDRLRIRGTVSGHQYRYSIATLASDGYVPRKARRIGDQEYFLRRQVKGQNGKVYQSALPERHVGPYNPRPGRGGPNRGAPNRGQ